MCFWELYWSFGFPPVYTVVSETSWSISRIFLEKVQSWQNVFSSFVLNFQEPVLFLIVHSLSHVWLFVIPWITPWKTVAHQTSLSFSISWSLLKLMSFGLVMPSSHLILCCPLLLPSILPSIMVYFLLYTLCCSKHLFACIVFHQLKLHRRLPTDKLSKYEKS